MELGGVSEDTEIHTRIVLIDDRGVAHVTFTRSDPWRLGKRLLVLVEGRAGGYDCSRCFVLPDDAFVVRRS